LRTSIGAWRSCLSSGRLCIFSDRRRGECGDTFAGPFFNSPVEASRMRRMRVISDSIVFILCSGTVRAIAGRYRKYDFMALKKNGRKSRSPQRLLEDLWG